MAAVGKITHLLHTSCDLLQHFGPWGNIPYTKFPLNKSSVGSAHPVMKCLLQFFSSWANHREAAGLLWRQKAMKRFIDSALRIFAFFLSCFRLLLDDL